MNQFWDVFWTCFYLPTITSDLILGWSFPGPHKQIKYPPYFTDDSQSLSKMMRSICHTDIPLSENPSRASRDESFVPQHCHKPFSANSALENHHDQHANHLQRGKSSISQSVYVNLFMMRCMYIQICGFMKYMRF